jgi:hypothetical protein
LVLSIACGPALPEGSSHPTPEVADISAEPPDGSCSSEALGAHVPIFVRSRTEQLHWDQVDRFEPCIGDSFARRTFHWTAPFSGTFVFDTAQSTFHTWLMVRRGCSGAVLACAAAGQGRTASSPVGGMAMTTLRLAQGESVTVTVFGRNSASAWHRGEFELHITELAPDERGLCGDRSDNDADGRFDCFDPDCGETPECAASACSEIDLEAQLPARVEGTTGGSGNSTGTPRVPQTLLHPDTTLTWTAPTSGTFVVESRPGKFLQILDRCAGAELETASASGSRLSHKLQLSERQTMVVVIESTEHDFPQAIPFELNIHEWASSEGGACNDGRDNDADGDADADDRECADD